ncbi:MAG: DUF4258 domain-containing protein [Lachnospiraceae bacterium]|nr:DUF4258 domain-containing protein [Lachnospiraceae bacterium]
MIDIKRIRDYYKKDSVYVTEYASERFRQRGIKARDIREAVANGEIIEQYPEDYPFPSCLICGMDKNRKVLHICMSDEGTSSRIITAYYPDEDRWSDDYRKRKETM